MDALEYQIEHMRFMSQVAERLSQLRLEFRSSTYDYATMGSWYFTFRKAGSDYRVVYEGRDYLLSLQVPRKPADPRWDPWVDVASSSTQRHLAPEALLEKTFALIQAQT